VKLRDQRNYRKIAPSRNLVEWAINSSVATSSGIGAGTGLGTGTGTGSGTGSGSGTGTGSGTGVALELELALVQEEGTSQGEGTGNGDQQVQAIACRNCTKPSIQRARQRGQEGWQRSALMFDDKGNVAMSGWRAPAVTRLLMKQLSEKQGAGSSILKWIRQGVVVDFAIGGSGDRAAANVVDKKKPRKERIQTATQNANGTPGAPRTQGQHPRKQQLNAPPQLAEPQQVQDHHLRHHQKFALQACVLKSPSVWLRRQQRVETTSPRRQRRVKPVHRSQQATPSSQRRLLESYVVINGITVIPSLLILLQ